jgi:hypothetical protein
MWVWAGSQLNYYKNGKGTTLLGPLQVLEFLIVDRYTCELIDERQSQDFAFAAADVHSQLVVVGIGEQRAYMQTEAVAMHQSHSDFSQMVPWISSDFET